MWFVYFNPFGFVIDSLGFMLFIYGLKKEDSDNSSRPYIPFYGNKQAYYKAEYGEDFKCSNCYRFGKPGCKREEKLLNAEACNDFMSK